MPAGDSSPSRLDDWFISKIWWKPAADLGERTRRRVTVHLIPYLFFLYILAYLDRANVAVAALGMKAGASEGGLGFNESIIGFGAGIFFWGYWILEIPSTISVVKWGARYVFVRILILWGLCCMLLGIIGTPWASAMFRWMPDLPVDAPWMQTVDAMGDLALGWLYRLMGYQGAWQPLAGLATFSNQLDTSAEYQFYFFRFMLGFFEGGFFPSVIVYLSIWFRAQDRAKAIAVFMAAIPLSNVLGLPLSGLLLGINWFDMAGWRWIFILEGFVPVLAGFVTLFMLPDGPHKAEWLPDDERKFLQAELEAEASSKKGHGHWEWVHHIGVVLLLTLFYFCINVTSYGLQMFMPAIIKTQLKNVIPGTSDLLASCVASLPYFLALIGMLLSGYSSDRTRERILHVGTPLCLLGCGLCVCYGVDGLWLWPVFVMIFLVGSFLYAHLPPFWPIPSMFLGATAAASAVGFINMIGNLGGTVGPTLVGKLAKEQTAQGAASFASGLLWLAPWPIAAAIVIVGVGAWRGLLFKKGPAKG
jgi:sugar phosphate permease